MGASAALKEAAKRLKSSASKFDSVLHLDCSLWKSRRALQKAIAEEIKLPHSVMAILSQHDKEDDFDGVEEGARKEVQEINTHTYRKLSTVNRLVVVFHNGSGSFIDLSEFGIPLNRNFKGDVLLWTMQGRFSYNIYEKIYENIPNMVYLYVHRDIVQLDDTSLWGIVNEEAKEVAQYTGIMDHMVVVACILYTWKLKDMGNIDWDTHASNYWVCDGIIQGSSSSEAWAWKVGDALQRNTQLDWRRSYMHEFFSSSAIEMQMQHHLPRPPVICCTSKIISVPAEATSFFLQPKYEDEESPSRGVVTVDTTIQLPASMFKHSASNLRVLHLSRCTFRFASPPFLYCSNLRFLRLHRCEDDGTSITPTEGKELDDQSGAWRACFGKLRVMDLSYTQWCWLLSERMMNIMANLRELNAKGIKNLSTSHLRGCGSLIKLRVEDGSVDGQRLILENSVALEQAVLTNDAKDEGATVDRIRNISFRGCAQLRSILLRGLFCCLHELDLSCTSVETVNLRKVQAQRLKRLILLGCQKLRAILWPLSTSSIAKTLDVFCVSTTPSMTASGQEWPRLCKWEEKRKEANSASTTESSSLDRNWYICVRDARLLRSLQIFRTYENNRFSLGWPTRVEFTTPPASGDLVAAQGVSILQQTIHVVDVYARDMITHNQLIHDEDATAGDEDGEGAIHWMWDCPMTRTMHGHGWYIHVQAEDDEQEGEGGEAQDKTGGTWSMPPSFICTSADVVHVHDCMSITFGISLSYITSWNELHWCRVERCPMLRSVFTAFSEGKENDVSSDSWLIFQNLTTFWASHLPMAKHIWNWSPRAYPSAYSFQQLQFLHLDYCPRVIFVLPLDSNMSLPQLETLEIICCGDLREIFRSWDPRLENQEEVVKHFPKLRRIHLHNLPTLRGICGRMMSSPMLETINVTGCPALRRLPAVGGRLAQPPTVVCEKDWWDGLEWDGLEAKHHPSLFRPKHSCHYRKPKLLRGSVLRSSNLPIYCMHA
ncbi:Disease resistance protein RPS2 [Zea mays]|uniref:Disease resistance protein RPS2 n=2 Tax=Zea mays TaxID=4577 RepID=A0A3L6FRU1_MAIZE|nr:Disease resistance protein RPS2 [Zea mays]